MSTVAENVLDAVEILMDNKVTGLQFNKTVRGTISEIIDESIGKYKIHYQDSYFTAYASDSNASYVKGSEVYVEILSNDFEKNALILGSVRRLGSNYISIIEQLDKYYEVGEELGSLNQRVELCSYNHNPNYIYKQLYNSDLNTIDLLVLNSISATQAAATADALKVSMKVQTDLAGEQRAGGGNYGLEVVVKYYDAAYVDRTENHTINRTYLFDINDMIGQPYKYNVPSEQYVIFPIDNEDFIEITSVRAFCRDFPVDDPTKTDSDIFLSDIHFQFLHSLTDAELNNSSLKITTPLGGYFIAGDTNEYNLSKILHADLRIKGKKVNYDAQHVDFYWFKRNAIVDSSHPKFSSYGGNGWECLNKMGGGSFLPSDYEYAVQKFTIMPVVDEEGNQQYDENGNPLVEYIENYPAEETTFRCVAVFSDSGQSVSLSATFVFKNISSDSIYKFKILSSSGTLFSFNIGKTTLTLASENFIPKQPLEDGVVDDNYHPTLYCWTEQIDSRAMTYCNDEKLSTNNEIDINISTPAARLLTYECSIYDYKLYAKEYILIGTAKITLINNYESLNYTLVIKDCDQIFKYDSYGVSPAARSKAVADRMVIPVLSFDIYDKQGNLIDIADENKNQHMIIRWVWPTIVDDIIDTNQPGSWDNYRSKNNTMLTTSEQNMKVVELRDIANNQGIYRFVLENSPTFTYGIVDRYNPTYANSDRSRNNLRLEVEYQGEYLSATTNFTFTKEGELGTNGTKFIARIEPLNFYDIFLCGKQLFGIQSDLKHVVALNETINESGEIISSQTGNAITINEIFNACLWDGSSNVAADLPNGSITWDLASSVKRYNKNQQIDSRLTINNNYVKMTLENDESKINNCIILQATITYGEQKYYATYPIIYTHKINYDYDDINAWLWISDGYREIMYDSDGTRSRFNALPFRPQILVDSLGFLNIDNQLDLENHSNFYTDEDMIQWYASWGAGARQLEEHVYQYHIEPPGYYIAESVGEYIKLIYKYQLTEDSDVQEVEALLPIELYLNRYGMSAMNDWDGNSIQINEEGGYILSPQIGAGRKNDDNTFTGITIGETFQDTVNKKKTNKDSEIGMFGYCNGLRSLFLDAETGDAEFGVAGKGQIKIHASDGEGTIDSGDYNYHHLGKDEEIVYCDNEGNILTEDQITSESIPAIAKKNADGDLIVQRDNENKIIRAGTGLKIKFTSTGEGDEKGPYIRYGSGNFTVDAKGHIVAQGGGSIAGWEITDDYLCSPDGGSILYSQNGPNMQLIRDDSEDAYQIKKGTNTVTYQWDSQRATRFNINDHFKVNEDGAIEATAGLIGGWKIGPTSLMSKDGVSWLFANKKDSTTNHSYMIGPMKTDNEGKPLSKNNYDNTVKKSMQVGRFSIGNDLNSFSWDNSNFVITEDGSLLGCGSSLDFTPHKRIWEITPKGVAYFTDIKIKNEPGRSDNSEEEEKKKENTFLWRGFDPTADPSKPEKRYPKIFELKDTGCNVGGFTITQNTLESPSIKINSNVSTNDKDTAVLSANEAFKIYGDGSFNASGGGKLGGCDVGSGGSGAITVAGGQSGITPADGGTLLLGGEQLQIQTKYEITGAVINYELKLGDFSTSYTPAGSVTVSGTDGEGKTINAEGSFEGTAATIKISNVPKQLNITEMYLLKRPYKVAGTKTDWTDSASKLNFTVNAPSQT